MAWSTREKRNEYQREYRRRKGITKNISGGGRPGRPRGDTLCSASQERIDMFRNALRGVCK
jgi:hypothetical protein